MHIIDSFPSPLYRAFDKKEYAQEFVEQGILRIRSLLSYCKIEDINRKDTSEGEGKTTINIYRPIITIEPKTGKTLSQTNEFGPVNFMTYSINPRYIVCFSGPQVDVKYLAGHYGKYIVCLSQPMKLVVDIAAHLKQRQDLPNEMWLDCIQVRYDKGQSIKEIPEPASPERERMSCGQKDPCFSNDYEYRLVLKLPLSLNNYPNEIKIELRHKLQDVEMLRL